MLLYLQFEHGTQLILPHLQRANFVGKSHDCGVKALVLLLRDTTVTSWHRFIFLCYVHLLYHTNCTSKSSHFWLIDCLFS